MKEETSMKANLKCLFLYLILLFISPAVMSDIVLPSDKTFNVSPAVELSKLAYEDFFIIYERAGHDTAHPEYYRGNHWHCFSATDTRTGACPVTSSSSDYSDYTYIKIDFTEEKTQVTVPLQLYAYANSYECSRVNGWPINSTYFETCSNGRVAYGKTLLVKMFRSTHMQLPYGGLWKATLKLRQRNYGGPGAEYNAVWTANIALKVSDDNSVAIYFPGFHTATPTVDLNLQGNSAADRRGNLVEGHRVIDMCLYDGRNAFSSWYDVKITDDMTISGRNSNLFSVLKDNASDKSAQKRIDYQIKLQHSGDEIEIINNRIMRLNNTSSTEQRLVMLPKTIRPVICTPTPLTLITPQLNQMDKEQGTYSGKLKVIFTPSLQAF